MGIDQLRCAPAGGGRPPPPPPPRKPPGERENGNVTTHEASPLDL
jgi:hypothetical protein